MNAPNVIVIVQRVDGLDVSYSHDGVVEETLLMLAQAAKVIIKNDAIDKADEFSLLTQFVSHINEEFGCLPIFIDQEVNLN